MGSRAASPPLRHRAEPSTKAGSRSKRSTAWLRKGENEIRFFPSKATPYGVRNLRIVGVPHQRIETAQFVADQATELGFDQPSQMHEIAFEVFRAGEGSLLVSGGKAKPIAISLHGFEPGWHRYRLDERVALGATLSMPAPKKKTRNKTPDDTRAIVSRSRSARAP